ncbi:hypothetical protein CDL12_29291 [Handroanthus impetiginosus]|uniref:TF-B3 domain-containing protein n=1 Tax=Handroanthus impetiginosus TaxID=429701 RepID=A0A2G9FZZ9_9LAMI|nr:hypothetical protein CDL12_29291 [Handroanthus impetiginosus]
MKNLGPSFYKIMLLEFTQKLRIPDVFVAEYRAYLSKTVNLGADLSENIWSVKIEEKDGEYWFTEGWPRFAQDYKLQFANFVVFRFIDGSRIRVTVFEPSGLEKEALFLVSHGTEESEESEKSDSDNYDDDDDDDDDELAELMDATKINKETSFTFTWRKYMRNNMPIKGSFVKKMDLTKIKGVKMRNLKGDVHDVRLYHYTDGRSGFGGGWAAFVDVSEFVLDETYKFEFIPNKNGELLVQMILMKMGGKGRRS